MLLYFFNTFFCPLTKNFNSSFYKSIWLKCTPSVFPPFFHLLPNPKRIFIANFLNIAIRIFSF
jgi:hypothetical protein